MIVDARLRDGNGIAAVETIHRITAIPHVFMSGERLPIGGALAVKLQKPFMYRDLANAIERAIGMASVGLAQQVAEKR